MPLLDRARELHDRGVSEVEILAAARSAWPSPIQSIKLLRELYGIPLSEAKRRLHASPVWADQVQEWERLHEMLEAEFAELPPPDADASRDHDPG